MKRQGVLVLAVLAVMITGGCVGLVIGDGVQMDGEPAAVNEETVDETEFTFSEYRTVHLNETVDVLGQERHINTTNHAVIYNRTSNLEQFDRDTGGFVVISTPDVSIGGQSVNPAARMSNRELVDQFQGELESQIGQIGELREVSQRTEPMLGYAANVTVFETETMIGDRNVTLYVHVTKVKHEGDLIAAIGVHPEALQQQSPEISRMIRNVEHPVSAPGA
ncbi:DUF6517 family protein [Salinarchaeum laminariae]|uniref:DUF6517 family protein n=1 Tax=Salinarchaeum laminariae TaxID=869888 RepID=UPI0020C04095|nr:DUF6517 family protein [Salinarchaeum laminariae]